MTPHLIPTLKLEKTIFKVVNEMDMVEHVFRFGIGEVEGEVNLSGGWVVSIEHVSNYLQKAINKI